LREKIMTDLLRIEDVSRAFGGLLAVNNVNMVVRDGEIVGLIGPNGAGKTTLFNVITGSFPATKGVVSFRGEDITRLDKNKIVRKGICRTYQLLRLFRSLSVLDNVLIGAHAQGMAEAMDALIRSGRQQEEEKRLRERSLYYLEKVGLADKKDLVAKNLSYGDQRRVEIARALAAEPTLLLLDEPSAGMNLGESRTLTEFIEWIRREMKKTILVIEHNMRVMMPIADRIVVLDHGVKIAEGAPVEVQNSEEVILAYLGKKYLTQSTRSAQHA
jgi:branched-chain amino acid transport system ATP-binding protein